MRIFMEGQEEWLEPCGEAMVVIAKVMLAGGFLALCWAAIIRFSGHRLAGASTLTTPVIVSIVLSLLSAAFWLAGKFSIFAGRKMRERGMKLP